MAIMTTHQLHCGSAGRARPLPPHLDFGGCFLSETQNTLVSSRQFPFSGLKMSKHFEKKFSSTLTVTKRRPHRVNATRLTRTTMRHRHTQRSKSTAAETTASS